MPTAAPSLTPACLLPPLRPGHACAAERPPVQHPPENLEPEVSQGIGVTRVVPRPPDPGGLLAAQARGCLQRKLAGHHFSHTFHCTSFQTLRLK